MQLIDQRVIYSGRSHTPTANCCFPALVRLADSTYLVSWRVGSQKDSADGKLLLSRSADNGRIWTPAETIPLGPYDEEAVEPHYGPISRLNDGGLLAAIMLVDRSDPSLSFFHPTTEGLLPTRMLFCHSRDAGHSWTDYHEMDHGPYHSPMPITGAVLQLENGDLACTFEVNKNYCDPQPWRHAAAWKVSNDGGRTWPECIEVANDPTSRLMYWDARYSLGVDGFCIATFWTYDRTLQHDAPIHLSISRDNGRHWSPPRDLGVEGQVCHPVLLENGSLVLVYVDRFVTRTIRAVKSHDLGHSFQDEVVVYNHAQSPIIARQSSVTADYLQEMDTWTFGRVDAVAGLGGQIAIVFYAGTPEATSIHWAMISTSSA
jgi:hypothetical protein